MIIQSCSICPRQCGGYRDENSGSGYCGTNSTIKVARVAPHYDEEPCISGQNGSGAIFFSGCVLKCLFCQNYKISQEGFGKEITPYELSEKYKMLEDMGVHNINLVSGTQYIPQIRESLLIYKPKLPIIFNCGGYERVESIKTLAGLIDVYLPDFKYADNSLALEYSDAKNYCEVAINAIEEMLNQTGKLSFDQYGMILKGTIIRHLILPCSIENSIEVLRIVSKKFGKRILFSLMAQYTPCGKAKLHNKLNRRITQKEYQKVLNVLFDLGLDGYAQELESSGTEFIPNFDLTGLI